MTRRLRVLQVVTDTTPRGAQVFGVDLHAELARRGHDVRTVALADEGAEVPLPIPALGSRRLGPRTLRRLRRLVLAADVAIAHGSSTLPACACATLGTGRPFVYRSIGDLRFWATTVGRRSRTGWALRRAAAVVVLWPEAANAVTEGFRVRHDRVHVVPNAVPAARWPAVTAGERAAARRSFGLAASQPVVVCVGALSPEKDVAAAITAVASLPGAHLLIVGDGPLRGELERLATRLAGPRVSFLGRTDPRPAVAAADAIVLSSRSEGLPGVLIEAGLAGIPAVATDVGGVDRIVRPGVTGELVAPGDLAALSRALERVLADRDGLGRAARRHCLDRFEIVGAGARWEAVLGEVAR